MSLIFGNINWCEGVDKDRVALLKSDLETYPSDEFDGFKNENIEAGLFSIRLRKAPFPQDKIVEDENIILIADARLDYRDELVEKLGLTSDCLKTQADSDLIYKSYKKWGKKCVDHLEGDFVFIIYHNQTKEVWGARDPIGFRPLFFIQKNQEFYFSTNLNGLVNLKFVSDSINEKFWLNRLVKIDCPLSATSHEHIFQVPIGHTVTIDDTKFTIKRFFYWKRKVSKKTSEEYELELEGILKKAVQTRLYADFEIGSHLSGGLDSSAVTAIASQQLNELDETRKIWSVSSVAEQDQKHERDERPWVNLFQSFFPKVDTAFFTLNNDFLIDSSHFNLFAFFRLRRFSSYSIDEKFQKHLEHHNCKTILTGWRGDHFISRHSNHALSELFFSGQFLFFFKNFKKIKNWKDVSSFRLVKKIIRNYAPLPQPSRIDQSLIKEAYVKKYKVEIEKKALEEKRWRKRGVAWDFMRNLPHNGNEMLFYMEDTSFLNKKPTCILHPLSDRRVIEFAINVPAIEMKKEGMDRSLFRRALKEILPEQLRLRTNKGYFNYNEAAHLKVIVADLLKNKMEFVKSSPFNEFVNVDAVILVLNRFLKTDSTEFKIDAEFVESLNIIGYLLYYSRVSHD